MSQTRKRRPVRQKTASQPFRALCWTVSVAMVAWTIQIILTVLAGFDLI